jgi:hypothetical protein
LAAQPVTGSANGNVSSSQGSSNNSGDVWTVSVSDDGSFNFYAAPRQSSGKSASSRWDDLFSAIASGNAWKALQMRYAVAQYALYASIPTISYGHSVDVYA